MAAVGLTVLAAGCAAPVPSPQSTQLPAQATAAPQATSVPAQPNAPVGIMTATPESNQEIPLAASPQQIRLNLNNASPEEFLALPNVDSSVVSEFQNARPYSSILEFRNAMGAHLDPARIAEFEQYVFVPIEVNTADEATLQQIPGVTSQIAQELIAGRPYGTNQNFLAKLVTLVSAEDTLRAQELLAP
jgi:DNA uptake protein ComE-like DNA-binding protein